MTTNLPSYWQFTQLRRGCVLHLWPRYISVHIKAAMLWKCVKMEPYETKIIIDQS